MMNATCADSADDEAQNPSGERHSKNKAENVTDHAKWPRKRGRYPKDNLVVTYRRAVIRVANRMIAVPGTNAVALAANSSRTTP